MKKVLLYDADSKWPSLPLMKISAFEKQRGNVVGWNIGDPDIVYAAVVFTTHRHRVDGLRFLYPNAEIHIGGSGVDLHKDLPQEIEDTNPDYSIYPGMDYSIGHTSRGCPNRCYFCVVPKKEGAYRRYKHPREWVKHKKAILLDNNIYADKAWFMETSEWLIENKIKVDINQGMDLRLIDEEIARQLTRLKWMEVKHFAWDQRKDEKAVFRGIEICRAAGIDMKHDSFVYVYCNDDSQVMDAVERCRILKSNGVGAFSMCNMDRPLSPGMKKLKKWTRPQVFWTCDYDEVRMAHDS